MLVRWTALVLAAMFLPVASGFAQDEALRPQIEPTAEQEAEQPAPQLVRLENSLAKAQEDKEQGRIDEKRYRELLTRFRADLDEAMTFVKPTPTNVSLRARILSRLGDSEQALAALGPALEQDPANPALRVALSQVHYDQKDYPAALAEANAVLARDPANKAALALKHSSEGRIGPNGAVPSMGTQGIPGGAVTEQLHSPLAKDSPKDYAQRVQKTVGYINSAKAALLAGRGDEALEWANKAVQTDPTPTAMKFAEEVRKIVDEGEVDEVPYNPKTPASKDGGMPLWPVLPISGLGAAAYVIAKSRKTVESEDGFDEENRPPYGRLQRFVAGAVLAGLAGAAIYLTGSAAIPIAARYLAVPGQHLARLAQSEAGAIAPRSLGRVEKAAQMSGAVGTKLGTDDAVATASRWVKPESGYYDVMLHGSPDRFWINRAGKWIDIDHRSLATFIKKQNNYDGSAIRLLSCQTGACEKGVARNLANKLGVPVKAPTDTLYVYDSGKMVIGPAPSRNTGTWKVFSPGEVK